MFAKNAILTRSGVGFRIIAMVFLRNYLRTTLGFEERRGLDSFRMMLVSELLSQRAEKDLLECRRSSRMKMSVDHGLAMGTFW